VTDAPPMTDAADIARALGGKRLSAGRYLCRCPVPSHGQGRGDRNPSLSVTNGARTLLFKCFAGCNVLDVLDALRRRGLLEDRRAERRDGQPAPIVPVVHDPDPAALQIWLAAAPATGSVVEDYLRHRGITLPLPPTLRCGSQLHLDCSPMPMMVAAAQRADGKVVAVQITLLSPAANKAPVATPRVTIGALGLGAVRLGKAGDVLGLAEGVETALAAMQMTGVPTWACLGAGRMHRVVIPDHVWELHLFGDNDDPGRAALERVARAQRHRRVILRLPPESCKDYNDFLMVRAGKVAA
jgi:putative DNA primase/helicase